MSTPNFAKMSKVIVMGIVDRIRTLCQEAGITLNQLEKAIGFKSTIARWEDHEPGLDKVRLVAQYFGMSVSELLDEKEKPAPMTGNGSYQDRLLSILNQLSDENQAQLLSYAEFLVASGRN